MQMLETLSKERNKKLNKMEQLKQLKTPLSVYEKLEHICKAGIKNLQSEDSDYFLKCFGIFLKKDSSFMLRLRIPAGQLSAIQAIKIGQLSKKYGKNYIDITTRQQIELRHIELENIYIILQELKSVGISTFQTGIDNFRNIVTTPFDGLGEDSLIECKPIIDELQDIFFAKEDYIGVLPRKFNTAILGNRINDCNVYGHDCCFIVASKDNKIGFNLYLGGKVGVQASNIGLFVGVEQVIATYKAIIELFKTYGFRDNRNKNRLHFLLEAVGMENFVEAIKNYTNFEYSSSGEILCTKELIIDNSGIIEFDENRIAIHFPIPSGLLRGDDLEQIGLLALNVDGFIRLSVEQSLYIITSKKYQSNVMQSQVFHAYKDFQNIYFRHQIACVGANGCAFGVIDSKNEAINLANFLQNEIPLNDAKVRIYWSACPKGCGIHGIADIGLEGCRAKDENGVSVDGVHIYLGGKVTKEAKEATIYAKAVPLQKAKYIIKDIIANYQINKKDTESFEKFYERECELR